jgi:hypothetical protein
MSRVSFQRTLPTGASPYIVRQEGTRFTLIDRRESMVCVASLHLQRGKRCARVAHVAAAKDWFYCWINGLNPDSGFSLSSSSQALLPHRELQYPH